MKYYQHVTVSTNGCIETVILRTDRSKVYIRTREFDGK